MSTPQGPTKKLNLQLWCGPIFVGDLLDVFVDQGTWYAVSFRQAVNRNAGRQEDRICDFFDLCEDWHQRLKRNLDPSASEFDLFLAELKNWRIRCIDGREMEIDAPIIVEGEVSWIRTQGDPNRSETAWHDWCSLCRHDQEDVRVN